MELLINLGSDEWHKAEQKKKAQKLLNDVKLIINALRSGFRLKYQSFFN